MAINELYAKITSKEPLMFVKGEDVLTNLGSEDFTLTLFGNAPSLKNTTNGVVASFDGDSYIELKNNVANRSGDPSNGFTVEALFHCNERRTYARIFDVGDGNGSNKNSNDIFCVATSGVADDYDTYVAGHHVGRDYIGELTHYLGRIDSNGNVDCFINGVFVGTTSGRNPNISLSDGNIMNSLNRSSGSSDEIGYGHLAYCVLHSRELTDEEVDSHVQELEGLTYDVSTTYIISLLGPVGLSDGFLWANKQTKEEANNYSNEVQTLHVDTVSTLVLKSGNYKNIINQDGESRAMGYFESKVLIQDIPAPNRKVMCFTQYGQLLDETYSDSSGKYRFDHLLLDTKYLFVAQDNQETPNTPPEYQAVAAGFQSATPYVKD
ncbi:hypothetical protein OW492_00520 [Psychromonas sp. 14N.309.X.WAT.B.A12]|uniref:LamG-like jellyroll fold domain-containing protein n=1 Tax=Psychromonas sp. 14N.309.X.WAT.B.A12 TaxID=2998322 RepID=UPI0025AEDDF4|nr:LamG-like jellyroll fold domain-containing protein [Psychromonas sp. 14N.309.X.WAT.B.A12]MDN2661855.1 hypothetical protein [Psychromonas sp. 14N.309.X.WAT.B.A12]